jgi:predicted aldo/keto reductase-like oxidoreductase
MHTLLFGKTGKQLSRLGFGCMRLPLADPADPGNIDQDLASAMLRKAIDSGVNYVDTAYPYHRSGMARAAGNGEPAVGEALKGGYREKTNLATKLPCWAVESRGDMDRLLDEQLERLQTSHIDFYLAHNLNRAVWPKMRTLGLFDFLEAAKRDGRILHAGFSFHDNYAMFQDILASYAWEFTQIQYNYLDADFQAGRRGLALAAGRGVPVIVMEPLRGGFLVNHMPDHLKVRLRALRPAWSLAEWGLRWLWSQPEVGLVLSGMSNMEQVEDNLAIANGDADLTEEDSAALDEARAYFMGRIKIGCTGCAYCMPCPSGVNIPQVLSKYNNYFLFETAAGRQSAKANYRMNIGGKTGARNCSHCRACEAKCPQSLPVSDEMTEVAALMEADA